MFRKIDESRYLIKYLQRLSGFLARNRGLPIIIGIVLIIAGFIIELINVQAASPTLNTLHIILQNVGLISALIGIILTEPIGQ